MAILDNDPNDGSAILLVTVVLGLLFFIYTVQRQGQ